MIDLSGTIADAFVHTIPLLLTGLAVSIAFRAGMWNIGADGQLLAGATIGTAVGLGVAMVPSPVGIVLMLLAGAVGGAAWASIAVVLRRRFGVSEVISTIMLNFIALNAVSYLVRGPLQEPSHVYPQTATLQGRLRLPIIWGGTRVHAGLVIALVIGCATWGIIRYTAAGFRLRATGESPSATISAARVDPDRVAMWAMIWSGALSGIAGAMEVSGVTFSLYENLSPGYGYTAIVVALLGRLDPIAIIGTALFFGGLESVGGLFQRDYGIPASLVLVIEAALVLAFLATERLRDAGLFSRRLYRDEIP